MKQMVAVCAIVAATAVLCAGQNPAGAVKSFIAVDTPTIVLTHVKVIDGTGAPARDDQTIVISGGKIQAVGSSAEVQTPQGAQVLDKRGCSVIPGLVGMHDHIFYPPGRSMYAELGVSFPRLYLANGVTTIRTTGSIEPYTDLSLKHEIDAGRMPGPKMHPTGPYLEGPGAFTPQMHQLKDADDARRTVAYWADEGSDNFKAYMNITRAELSAAIQEAHRRGLKVTGHLCSVGFREAAQLGIDDLEHGLLVDSEFAPGKQPDICPEQRDIRNALVKLDVDGPEIQQTIRELVARKVAVTSTLPVFETFVPDRPPLQPRVLDAMTADARIAYLTRRALIAESKNPTFPPELFNKEMQFERAFAQAGGLLLAGEDPTGYGGALAGFGDQRGLELLVEAGFTPLEAIKIGTYNGAQYLGELDRIGSIAPGKQADLVLIHGDPDANINDIEKVETVFKNGVGWDSAKLIESVRGMVGIQ